MEERWRELRALFDLVVDLPEGERHAALVRACGTQPERIQEVLSLVRSAVSSDGFLAPLAGSPASASSDAARLGRFVLGAQLGAGPRGTVHAARGTPGEALLAVRIVPLDERATETVARLRHVSRLLSGLAHPALARTVESGLCVWPAGSRRSAVYFATELVPSARSWTAEDAGDDDALRGNLERLLDASDAVALAHARGLHHGGLATSNVLIDAEQRVRVVDLGVRSVFPDADGPPSAAGDRVALAERLAALLGPASPLERAWRTAARELALRAARSDAGGELATLAGFAAALRREIT